MVAISITGIKGVQGKLKNLANTPFLRPMLSEIGMYAMHRIKKRTLKGDDVNDISFKPYSVAYAKERAKAGFPVKPVDLSRSGSMLSAMTYDTKISSVDIFFMNTTDSTGARNPSKAFFLNKDREFFSLSETDIQGIMKIVSNYYDKLTKGI